MASPRSDIEIARAATLAPMRCPRCKADKDRVVDSRASADGTAIRRRRECLECFLRYTTYERIENTPLRVEKTITPCIARLSSRRARSSADGETGVAYRYAHSGRARERLAKRSTRLYKS